MRPTNDGLVDKQLLPRAVPQLKSIELNGEPELIATTFVGGLKHLPIRCSLR